MLKSVSDFRFRVYGPLIGSYRNVWGHIRISRYMEGFKRTLGDYHLEHSVRSRAESLCFV